MKDVAEILRAVGSLAWPCILIYVLYRLGPELKDLLGRITKAKFLGTEFELRNNLDKLNREAEALASALPLPAEEANGSERLAADFDTVERILSDAARSPKAALLLLAAELEKEIRDLVGNMGWRRETRRLTLIIGLQHLDKLGKLPANLAGAAKLFYDVRNQVVHGYQSSDDDALMALDSGLMILRSIQAIPREVTTVFDPGVALYEDDKCTRVRPNVKGVILEMKSPNADEPSFRIFPTTQAHFQKGKKVTMDWGTSVVAESWYRDPETLEIKYAWEASAEFVGRNIDDL